MKLPGGLLKDGLLRQDFSFNTITGELERRIAESGVHVDSLAEQVTIVLASTLHEVGGMHATTDLVRGLSCGDRQYLLHQLAALINPSPYWITESCQECSESIQFQIVPGTLPVKAADDSFPRTLLALSIGEVALRVPNGADEEAIACGADNEQAALGLLLQRLVSWSNQNKDIKIESDSLAPDDLQLIDTKLDHMSPQLGDSISIACPYCSHQQLILLDHYNWISSDTRGLDDEIHTLAFHYHWSEKEILALTGKRRKRYIHLIERNLGYYQAEGLTHRP